MVISKSIMPWDTSAGVVNGLTESSAAESVVPAGTVIETKTLPVKEGTLKLKI
jgi:hypothetical protein